MEGRADRIYPGPRGPLESSAMSTDPCPMPPIPRRETLAIAAFTVFGGLLRMWSIGHLGLVHFDEGIYAMAGTWILSPRGFAGIDPTLISYSPPGFPYLVGFAYGLFGIGDIAAILVSIAMGTLTIPVAGWLGRRTFGPGAGAGAAAMAALSGPHIGFSRMALTDASFLFFWLVAIGMGQRFLERPGPVRALMMGLAVGVAQLFKYNGWLAGVVVALSAAVWIATHPEARNTREQARIWGWGMLAAVVAAVVYLPWFGFVETHGGYSALLAHHRSYMGGPSTWMGHLRIQIREDALLMRGRQWMGLVGVGTMIGVLASFRWMVASRRFSAIRFLEALGLAGILGIASEAFVGGAGALVTLAIWLGRGLSRTAAVVAVGWGLMALLTPFYHPYARLTLPLVGLTWILVGGAATSLFRYTSDRAATGRFPGFWFAGFLLLSQELPPDLAAWQTPAWTHPLLESSDSLRLACRSVAAELPRDVPSLRIHARPPVTFYLSGVVPVALQATPEGLVSGSDRRSWVLLDSAMLGPGGAERARQLAGSPSFELVREIPTTMNLPTLLDVDPSTPIQSPIDVSAPLFLLRPKRPGVSR